VAQAELTGLTFERMMNKNDRKKEFDIIANELVSVYHRLERLRAEVGCDADRIAIDRMMVDLAWAIENCSVIGLHQIGKALDDNMGTGCVVSGPK